MVMTFKVHPGCISTTKLPFFPTNRVRALRWLQILGIAEDSRTSKLKVRALLFTNYTQAQTGFALWLHLTEDGLPDPPQGGLSRILKDVGCQTDVRNIDASCQAEPCVNHFKCQTVQIGKHFASTQANRKPFKRSKESYQEPLESEPEEVSAKLSQDKSEEICEDRDCDNKDRVKRI